MAKIIDGKAIAQNIADKLKAKIRALPTAPKLAIVTYRADERSKVYVNLKLKRAEEIGIQTELIDWSDMEQDDCLKAMQKLGERKDVNGIIVQLPLNGWYDPQMLLDLIPPHKDVDGLSMQSLEDLKQNKAKLIPATPRAVLTALDYENIDLGNKKIVIVGQGKLVGLPLGLILSNKGCDVETADINTKYLAELTKQADVLISAAGQPDLITGNMVKPGSVVLDVGIVEINGKLAGDVDYKTVEPVASLISKVPGGIGPITVVSLLQNVVEATKNA